MIVIHPSGITCWQFPEDSVDGKAAFLHYFSDPSETWLRAFAFTMEELAEDIIAAHEKGTAIHTCIDYSQSVGHAAHAKIERMVAAGVEVTIATSPAGTKFISHEKGYTTANGDCWEGSTNFSESAWRQVNTALQWNSPEWRDMTVASFNEQIRWAWRHEANKQLMSAPPAVVASALEERPA